jgi:hypothetical protein
MMVITDPTIRAKANNWYLDLVWERDIPLRNTKFILRVTRIEQSDGIVEGRLPVLEWIVTS